LLGDLALFGSPAKAASTMRDRATNAAGIDRERDIAIN
jgi:hypothetical protein